MKSHHMGWVGKSEDEDTWVRLRMVEPEQGYVGSGVSEHPWYLLGPLL